MTDRMIVVLNKVDLFPPDVRAAKIDKVTRGLQKALAPTKFASAPIIPVAASVTSSSSSSLETTQQSIGLEALFDTLRSFIRVPTRSPKGPFVFAFDHG